MLQSWDLGFNGLIVAKCEMAFYTTQIIHFLLRVDMATIKQPSHFDALFKAKAFKEQSAQPSEVATHSCAQVKIKSDFDAALIKTQSKYAFIIKSLEDK